MNKKMTHINFNSIFCFVTICTIILFSKSVYFSIINRELYQYVFYGISIASLFLIKNKNNSKNSLMFFILLATIMILNLCFNFTFMEKSQINQVFAFLLSFFCMHLITNTITSDIFSKWYIRIICIICLISLPCFVIAKENPNLALTFCQSGYNWETPYGYSIFYTWGINGVILSRNSGIFWEPGAFQGFIILGLLMLIYNMHNNSIKHVKLILFIFILTLLTTQSSTGYILLIILILVYRKKISNIINLKINKKVKWIFVLIFSIVILSFIIYSGNISRKFFNDTSGSTDIRSSDFTNGFKLTFNSGLIGLGETNKKIIMKSNYNINVDDSVGLFAMMYTFGIPFGIIYLTSLYKGLKDFFTTRKRMELNILFLIFLVLHSTEGLWFLPVYLYFVFYRKNIIDVNKNRS